MEKVAGLDKQKKICGGIPMPSKVPYQKPDHLLNLKQLSAHQLRIALSKRIHSAQNQKSTGAFMDIALCYFEPWLILDVVVKAMPELDRGNDPMFTSHRQRVIASVVARLRAAHAVEDSLLGGSDYYCGKFRLCLGHGYGDPTFEDLWLVPVRPAFFWGEAHEGVDDLVQVVDRRRLTGLAALRWVTPLNGGRP